MCMAHGKLSKSYYSTETSINLANIIPTHQFWPVLRDSQRVISSFFC